MAVAWLNSGEGGISGGSAQYSNARATVVRFMENVVRFCFATLNRRASGSSSELGSEQTSGSLQVIATNFAGSLSALCGHLQRFRLRI